VIEEQKHNFFTAVISIKRKKAEDKKLEDLEDQEE
jgi:hypothetical protein